MHNLFAAAADSEGVFLLLGETKRLKPKAGKYSLYFGKVYKYWLSGNCNSWDTTKL